MDETEKILTLSGELTFNTVQQLARETQKFIEKSVILGIDLAQVESSDSAGLALLIDLWRQLRQTNHPFRFYNVPAQVIAQAEVVGIADLLNTGGASIK